MNYDELLEIGAELEKAYAKFGINSPKVVELGAKLFSAATTIGTATLDQYATQARRSMKKDCDKHAFILAAAAEIMQIRQKK